MKLVNHHTGQFRTFTPIGAFFGTLFLGPIYILFKGVWTWGLLMLGIDLLLAFTVPPLLFLVAFLWAAVAPLMIESFYRQRGFDVPENRPATVPPPPTAQVPQRAGPKLAGPYSLADDRVMQGALLCFGIAIIVVLFVATTARAQTTSTAQAGCPDPWPPQAASREQVHAALGVDPCGTEGTTPLPPSPDTPDRPAPSAAFTPMPAAGSYTVRSESTGDPVRVRVHAPPPAPAPRVITRTYNNTTTIYRDVPVPVYRDRPVYQPPIYVPTYVPSYRPRPYYGGGYGGGYGYRGHRRW